jgi:hypothetical protein
MLCWRAAPPAAAAGEDAACRDPIEGSEHTIRGGQAITNSHAAHVGEQNRSGMQGLERAQKAEAIQHQCGKLFDSTLASPVHVESCCPLKERFFAFACFLFGCCV